MLREGFSKEVTYGPRRKGASAPLGRGFQAHLKHSLLPGAPGAPAPWQGTPPSHLRTVAVSTQAPTSLRQRGRRAKRTPWATGQAGRGAAGTERTPARSAHLAAASEEARCSPPPSAPGAGRHPLSNREVQAPSPCRRGLEQNSPGGRRHLRQALASREVRRQLSPLGPTEGDRDGAGPAVPASLSSARPLWTRRGGALEGSRTGRRVPRPWIP